MRIAGAHLPRRVLMTADAVGGVWQYALELGRGLREAGVEVVLAVMGPGPDQGQVSAAARAGLELHAAPFRLEWMDDPWEEVAAAGHWLLDLERRRGCDLVHLNGYAHGALPFAGPRLVAGHSCVLSWWQAVRGAPAPASWERYRREVRAGLAGADQVIAPSRSMLAALREQYGPLRGQVIYNGRPAEVFLPRPKSSLVLSAGRLWDEGKNVRILARVAERLPWPVAIAGSPGAGNEGGLATWLGPLPPERLARLMAEAAIYVSPARYEPFGLAVLEAALSGCALVLSDIPSLRELWRGAALFVPCDDEDALAAALLRLMSQPALREEWARRARRRALRYSARRMVKGHLAVYRALVQPGEACTSCAS
jgi:glycosyltransferase involved in cell wall biosynthesis